MSTIPVGSTSHPHTSADVPDSSNAPAGEAVPQVGQPSATTSSNAALDRLSSRQTLSPRNQLQRPRDRIDEMIAHNPSALRPRFEENSIEADKENMPYHDHAQMVMGQFEKYFASPPGTGAASQPNAPQPLISDELMSTMLMFHDMSKQRSIATHGKVGEHVDTVADFSKFSRHTGLSPAEVRMAADMVGSDPFGTYFKRIQSINSQRTMPQPKKDELAKGARIDCFQQIVAVARHAHVPDERIPEFAQRYMQFYQSDFSSYSTDSSFVTGDGARKSGPDSFKPEFFERSQDKTQFQKTSDGTRLKFSSEKQLEEHAESLMEMFKTANIGGHLEAHATPEASAKMNRAADLSEANRAHFEMQRSEADNKLESTRYLDFEAPLAGLSKLLGPAASPAELRGNIEKMSRMSVDELKQTHSLDDATAKSMHEASLALSEMMATPRDAAPMMRQFEQGGVFIRKLVPETPGSSSRAMLQKDLHTMQHHVGREPLTPFVMPSTLVHKGLPFNLTNAQDALLHSSGIILDQDTPIAPSTKEHSESAKLSTILTPQVRERVTDTPTWRGIVSATVSKTGGRSYESRPALVGKLFEMEWRRSGQMPDLSTKELVHAAIEKGDGADRMTPEQFEKDLEHYRKETPLNDTIVAQMKHAFQSASGSKTLTRAELMKATGRKRSDRAHSIYGGRMDGRDLAAGNRYFAAEKRETQFGSSEAERFDGKSFQTNEVLLLPDSPKTIQGVYSNHFSVASRVHSLNLAREVQLQTGRAVPLFGYDAHEGMTALSVEQVLHDIHTRMGKQEEARPGSGLHFGEESSAPQESSQAAAKAVATQRLNSLFGARSAWLPEGREEKKRAQADESAVRQEKS